jgi:hypothetical protein
MITSTEQVRDFVAKHSHLTNANGNPNWIEVTLVRHDAGSVNRNSWVFIYDFKNDEARKAFGALCHRLYTVNESWVITTSRYHKLN